MNKLKPLFDRCVCRTRDGRRIRCKLGLWAVDAPTSEIAEREAQHYWFQYWQDGEYDSFLSNASLEARAGATKED